MIRYHHLSCRPPHRFLPDRHILENLDLEIRDCESVCATRAEIVRAYYDAADLLLSDHHLSFQSAEAVFNALRDLSEVVAQVNENCQTKFVETLEAAAKTYFERVAAIQRNAGPSLGN